MEDKYTEPGPQKREFIRLQQVIPAAYNLIDDLKSLALSRKIEAVITDISAGGVRIEIDDLDKTWAGGLYSGAVKLGVEIRLPGLAKPVQALARVVWLNKGPLQTETGKVRYIMGLAFRDITTVNQDIIEDYIIKNYLKD